MTVVTVRDYNYTFFSRNNGVITTDYYSFIFRSINYGVDNHVKLELHVTNTVYQYCINFWICSLLSKG